jgi:hypothetical protein
MGDPTPFIDALAKQVLEVGPGFGPWNHLTCDEAEIVANILKAAEHAEAADMLIHSHGEGDDEPADQHHNIYLDIRLQGLEDVERECRHCGRAIVNVDGAWVDPEAKGDDSVWPEVCDSHDTFTAEHEPI